MAIAELVFAARYAAKRREYRMPEGVSVNELWLRAKVGKGRERPIDIPDEVIPFYSDSEGWPQGEALPWETVLGPGASIVYVDQPSKGGEP